jgi:hypothetical protein
MGWSTPLSLHLPPPPCSARRSSLPLLPPRLGCGICFRGWRDEVLPLQPLVYTRGDSWFAPPICISLLGTVIMCPLVTPKFGRKGIQISNSSDQRNDKLARAKNGCVRCWGSWSSEASPSSGHTSDFRSAHGFGLVEKPSLYGC